MLLTGSQQALSVSSRRATALGWGLALSLLLVLALGGLWVYGYQLFRAQADRLAQLEVEAEGARTDDLAGETAAPAPTDASSGDTVTERLQANEQRIAILGRELEASLAAAERAGREQEALRLKLAHADRMRHEVEAALAASQSRIAALEAELGAGGSVDTLIDETGQPLVDLETVSPRDLATLGMELRLVERERDGARVQLDRAFERITVLEAAQGDATAAAPADQPTAGSTDAHQDDAALAARVAELEAANLELAAARTTLELTLAGVEAEREALAESEAATRADLQARLAALEAENDVNDDLIRELEAALATAEGRIAEFESGLASASARRELLETERDDLLTRLDRERRDREAAEAERDGAVAAAGDAAASIERRDAELAALADELAAERAATVEASARLAGLEDEHRQLRQALEAEREAHATSVAAQREATLELASEREALVAERDRLRTAIASAEAAAGTATTPAIEATRRAEQADDGIPAMAAERDAVRSRAAELAAEIDRLRDELAAMEQANAALEADRSKVERASRDALDARDDAHRTALTELTEERDALRAELEAERVRVAALNDHRPAAGRNGDGGHDGAAAALKAANDRIAALEAELDAIVRLAAELGDDGSRAPASGPTATAISTVPDDMATSGEAAAALARVEALERELGAARARAEAMQDLLFADWPVRPRAAPR